MKKTGWAKEEGKTGRKAKKRRRARTAFLAVAFGLAAFASFAQQEEAFREWKSRRGNVVVTGKIEIKRTTKEFGDDAAKPENVYFRGENGKLYRFKYEKLCDADQNRVDVALGLTEPSTAGARPIGVLEPKDGAFESPSGRKAFLVAADDYGDAATSLSCTKNDVEAFSARLVEIGFEARNVTTLKTGGSFRDYPTKENIERRFAAFVENLAPGDFVILYLSGHGVQPSDSKEAFFAPIDVDPSDIYGSAVSINEMLDALEKSPATFRWAIVDACRNDPKAPTRSIFTSKTTGARGLVEISDAPDSISLLQSCQPGRFSYEGGVGKARDVKNGFFTLSLLEALDQKNPKADANGDGVLTFSEMFQYVSARTNKLAFDYYGKTQKPKLSGTIEDFALLADLNTAEAQRRYNAAVAARKAGDYEKAQEEINAALELTPDEETYQAEKATIMDVVRLRQKLLEARTSKPNESGESKDYDWNDARWQAGDCKVVAVAGAEYAFRYCPAGDFMMGSPESEPGRFPSETLRKVTFNKGFWILETEITRAMYFSFVKATLYKTKSPGGSWLSAEGDPIADAAFTWQNPGFPQNEKHPVTQVTAADATAFCEWLTREMSAPVRLPNEEEWEYACRAGATTAYSFGDETLGWQKYANFADASLKAIASEWPLTFQRDDDGFAYTAPVGSYAPNNWNIFDMHGNVREWCRANASERSEDADDGFQFEQETDRDAMFAARGGAWTDPLDWGRAARSLPDFSSSETDLGYYAIGFRIVVDAGASIETSNDGADAAWNSASKAGERRTLKVNDVECAFRYCPAGTFQMGAAKSELSGPRHEVTLTRGFWMMETETTQALWKAVTGKNPSGFAASGEESAEVRNLDTSNFPVERVSWEECRAFAERLNAIGAAPVGFEFALPTEAQWEYACRAGTTGDYGGSELDALAWYRDNAGDRPREVGKKSANPWGIFDMHGNVQEWCADLWQEYDASPATDPTGATQNESIGFWSVRGGSFADYAQFCQTTCRNSLGASPARTSALGVRFVLNPR